MIPEKMKAALDGHIAPSWSRPTSTSPCRPGASRMHSRDSVGGCASSSRRSSPTPRRWSTTSCRAAAPCRSVPWERRPPSSGRFSTSFEKTLDHERQVTGRVHRLHDLAGAEKDTATQIFLQWFVTEQVEEEARVSEIVDKLRMVSDRPARSSTSTRSTARERRRPTLPLSFERARRREPTTPLPFLPSPLSPSSSRARALQARAPRRAVGGGRGVGQGFSCRSSRTARCPRARGRG